MPTYDFRCTECSTTFEVNRPMSVRGDEVCPACGARATKVFSPVGVSFKGSGFHNTDYKPRPKEDSPCSSAGSTPACGNCPSAG
jgi:putative FmdB family regulatory protein